MSEPRHRSRFADQVLQIPDLRAMQAVAEVDEARAGRLAIGQRVRFHLDAHPDLTKI